MILTNTTNTLFTTVPIFWENNNKINITRFHKHPLFIACVLYYPLLFY